MKKQEELVRTLTELIKETKEGKLNWKVSCQTTEYNPVEDKPVVKEEDMEWTVDECYVSYYCEHKGKEFLMISYEMIHQAYNKTKTTNMVFLPPLGIRYFDLHVLAPYAVETDQMLAYYVHMLWMTLLETAKGHPQQVVIDADARVLTIEEE